jgi:hypothetical protein
MLIASVSRNIYICLSLYVLLSFDLKDIHTVILRNREEWTFSFDLTGYQQISSLDLISTSGLINYFGKWTDLTQVEISPLLMRKGVTRLALYGLSHLKDERLARLFMDYKVSSIIIQIFSVYM